MIHLHPPTVILGLAVVVFQAVLAPPGAVGSATARYRLTFEADWSAATHPDEFPAGPHFSGLIGGTHGSGVVFWQAGELASSGIENMAELGSKQPLRSEIEEAIRAGLADSVITGPGLGVSPGQATVELTVRSEYPLVTVVSMVAPSPDWFVGVAGLSLRAGEDWVVQRTVELHAWDAGTDSGPSFASPDDDTQPRELIAAIATPPLGGTPALGRFVFTRLDASAPQPLLLRGGRFEVTASWQTRAGARGDARPLELTDDTGALWFFTDRNIELVVKVLDACARHGRFWVFAGGLTNLGVELRVTDRVTGQEVEYTNPLGEPFQPIQDTSSLSCP